MSESMFYLQVHNLWRVDHNKIFVHVSFIMRQLHGRYAHLYLLGYCSSYQDENFGTDFFFPKNCNYKCFMHRLLPLMPNIDVL